MDEQMGSAVIERVAQVLKMMLNAMLKILKTALKVVAKFLKWIFSFVMSNFAIVVPILLVVVVVAVVVYALFNMFSGGYDSGSKTLSPINGIRGDSFYGQRYLYYDDAFTTNDLANVYLNFTYDILKEVNSSGVEVKLDFTKAYYSNENIQNVSGITLSYATALANKENDATLLECTKEIQNYGFDSTQKNIVFSKMSEYIFNNNLMGATAQNIIVQKLNEIYEAEDSNFAYMKNVCKKILIKDYLCDGENGISNIQQKKYFGVVYMPKQDMTINATNIAIKVDGDATVDVAMKNINEGEINEITSGTADSSWFNSGVFGKVLTCELKDYPISKFLAIDESNISYLQQEKTLFQILKDGRFSTYFNDGLENFEEQTLMENFKSKDYLYLSLNSGALFNVADIVTEY